MSKRIISMAEVEPIDRSHPYAFLTDLGISPEWDDEIITRPPYIPIGVSYAYNGCCPKRPIVLTVNFRQDGSRNYSAQCACDGWCTNGYDRPEDALNEYKRMSDGENLFGGFMGFVF